VRPSAVYKLGILCRKAARWMKRPTGRRRCMPTDNDDCDDDVEGDDDDNGQQPKPKKQKKRKNDGKEVVSCIVYTFDINMTTLVGKSAHSMVYVFVSIGLCISV